MNLHSIEFKRVGFLSRSVESQIFCWLHVFTPSGRRLGATQVRRLIGWSPTTFYALFASPPGLLRPPTMWAGLSQPIQGKQGPLFKSRQMAKSARLQGHRDTVQWVEQINKCTQDSAGSSGFPLLFPHLPRDSTSKHWNYITNCEEIVGYVQLLRDCLSFQMGALDNTEWELFLRKMIARNLRIFGAPDPVRSAIHIQLLVLQLSNFPWNFRKHSFFEIR